MFICLLNRMVTLIGMAPSLHPIRGLSTFIANNLTHSSIKVKRATVCSIHIDNGFSDCLQNSICSGDKEASRFNVTQQMPPNHMDHLPAIKSGLEFSMRDHVMLWAACCLGFFGFLRVDEFTVNSEFQPTIQMIVENLQEDSLVNPTQIGASTSTAARESLII